MNSGGGGADRGPEASCPALMPASLTGCSGKRAQSARARASGHWRRRTGEFGLVEMRRVNGAIEAWRPAREAAYVRMIDGVLKKEAAFAAFF
jgi:hypothetical protein